jgi:tetratricopeptide (TPR) repeat protein
MQLYGMAPVYHGQFKITGHFFNPAPYAGFLVASLPFALLLSAVRPNTILNRTIYWSGYLSVCLILVAIPSTRSRAAYLGLAAVLLLWFFFRYHPLLYLKRVLNTPLKRKFAYWVAPLLLVAVLTTLYLFKKDSASGRLLIWKVAAHTIAERPLTGHGFNTAQATLAPAQANYFVTGSGTEREQMLAGSVRWVFNEFLQIASETGLIGLALFLLVVGFALLYKLPASLSLQNRLAIGAARASVVGILVFGCFSYPFYSLPVTLLFFFSLAILAALQPNLLNRAAKVYNPILKPVLFAGIIALSVFYIRQIPKLKQAYWLWDEAGQLYQMGAYTEANESFAEAYPVLSHNGLFLQQYGKSLAMEEEYTQAIEILCQATSYYNDEFTGITLGNCYQAIGDYANAETQYLLAANTVPHKFYPLYLLAKLYNESGQTEKATAMAKELLRKEIKVPSKAIEEIKAEMQQLIDNNASLQISNKPKEKGRKPVCANKALPAWALPLQERR